MGLHPQPSRALCHSTFAVFPELALSALKSQERAWVQLVALKKKKAAFALLSRNVVRPCLPLLKCTFCDMAAAFSDDISATE